ncbi:MAG: 4-hydroxy-tetrahydrodipicolinate reductase [Flavobacteriales bacterium]|nr:4-hydroxy-tetrahydrodipicolinate reductase [Flavobacteriales bacterium]
MKIAIIGYGKMGVAIEKIAIERGHEVVLKINLDNMHEFTIENLKKCDVAIEFTEPSSVITNIYKCFEANLPVVVGTTGWYNKFDEIKSACLTTNNTLLHATNYSLGVNLFFELNKKLAQLMNNYSNYNVMMEEIHHTEKKDAPSGTAITLAEGIIENLDRKNKWVNNQTFEENELSIISKRINDVPGTHEICYQSAEDDITITHTAYNRNGFALGAVIGAEYIHNKKGIFTMKEVLFSLPNPSEGGAM